LGSPFPSFSATFAGFVPGEDETMLAGALAFATSATSASPVGVYPITPSGLTSINYAISFLPGSLTISGASGGNPTDTPEGGSNPLDVFESLCVDGARTVRAQDRLNLALNECDTPSEIISNQD